MNPADDSHAMSARAAITVTPARRDDVAAISALETTAFGTDAMTPRQVARFLERYPDLLLVARGGDQEVAGYIIGGGRGNPEFDLDAPVGWVNSLAVHPHYRRRGVADTLLVALFAALRARGLSRAMLYVEPDNAGALALYARHGFRADRDPHASGEPRVTLGVSLI